METWAREIPHLSERKTESGWGKLKGNDFIAQDCANPSRQAHKYHEQLYNKYFKVLIFLSF